MNRLFYNIKPFIPRWLQIIFRRFLIKSQIPRYREVWPILEGSAEKPEGFPGWPNNKHFALVLTHDVETWVGHERCRELLELERNLGFRSSFNFVPKRYEVSLELRRFIWESGFEVGVHDLYHDGKLYSSKEIFDERAREINWYLKEWNAKGFRSGSMHCNLSWISDLNIEYDASTFDTDPFEPQPEGTGTIFPFWVDGNETREKYLELPYTLPQDFTLFIIMQQRNIEVWKKKLDWIAKNGGMALLTTHPDYMCWEKGKNTIEEYPIEYYEEFLNYLRYEYGMQFWNPLPRDLVGFWKKNVKTP
ncbi:MAG: hypothetical protein GTO02_05135 [Candidatus Dadabacteria bacterium]|nr:hypothetical protein [Candidatus Dadabacteria bacterium]